jgi:putative oxidoreductase
MLQFCFPRRQWSLRGTLAIEDRLDLYSLYLTAQHQNVLDAFGASAFVIRKRTACTTSSTTHCTAVCIQTTNISSISKESRRVTLLDVWRGFQSENRESSMTSKHSFYPSLASLTGRLLMAFIFIISGCEKVAGYNATASLMATHGLLPQLLPVVILTELGGGLALVLGWRVRWVALALAGYSVLSALAFHLDLSNADQMFNFLKNLAMAGGFLQIYAFGSGRFALDYLSRSAVGRG